MKRLSLAADLNIYFYFIHSNNEMFSSIDEVNSGSNILYDLENKNVKKLTLKTLRKITK